MWTSDDFLQTWDGPLWTNDGLLWTCRYRLFVFWPRQIRKFWKFIHCCDTLVSFFLLILVSGKIIRSDDFMKWVPLQLWNIDVVPFHCMLLSNCLQGLKVIDLQQSDYMRTLESSIQFGLPVLLQNVHEQLDPSLDSILNKSIIKVGMFLVIITNCNLN